MTKAQRNASSEAAVVIKAKDLNVRVSAGGFSPAAIAALTVLVALLIVAIAAVLIARGNGGHFVSLLFA